MSLQTTHIAHLIIGRYKSRTGPLGLGLRLVRVGSTRTELKFPKMSFWRRKINSDWSKIPPIVFLTLRSPQNSSKATSNSFPSTLQSVIKPLSCFSNARSPCGPVTFPILECKWKTIFWLIPLHWNIHGTNGNGTYWTKIRVPFIHYTSYVSYLLTPRPRPSEKAAGSLPQLTQSLCQCSCCH